MSMYEFSPEMKSLLESSKLSFGVFQVVDGQYQTVLVSAGACEIFELPHEELKKYLSNKSYQKIHPDDAGKLIEAAKRFTTNDENTIICRLKRKGAYHPILFHERAHKLPDGTVLYVCSYYDLSDISAGLESTSNQFLAQQKDQLFQDSVTGLPNMNFYKTFGPGTVRQYLDQGSYPYFILFDVNGMHYYNDRFGYAKGDDLLKALGGMIKKVFYGDFCNRTNEDRFMVITARADIDQAVADVRRLFLEYVEETNVDLNVGIYKYHDPSVDVVSAADKARSAIDYIRRSPDQHVRFYDKEVKEKYHRTNYVLSHYRDAIGKDWIQVYYQPIISSLSGKVSHAEALSRWVDPVHGFMNPADFIEILENDHKLYELDLYVIEKVCQDIRKRKDEGLPTIHVTVNLSRHDLDVADIHERINAILRKYSVEPAEVHIEITESALVNSEEVIGRHIRRFHQDGYRVWLDDFGSGYSSFNALQDFDFDVMKIDMNFLRHQNERTPDILKSILEMTKRLKIQSVTEGVETEEQKDFLKEIGCNYLQGFYYSKPVPSELFSEVIDKLGLQYETEEDHQFYRNFLNINVLEPNNPLPGSRFQALGRVANLTFVIEEGDKIEIIYTDATGRKWMRAVGAPSFSDISERAMNQPMVIQQVMKACFRELKEVGDIVMKTVNDPTYKGDMEVLLLSKVGNRRGFLIYTIGG